MRDQGADRPNAAVLLAGMFCLFAGIGQAPGQEASESESPKAPVVTSSDVKQLFVPADRPAEWPKGDWEAIGIEDYRRLLDALKPKPLLPTEVAIEKAIYQALITGENLKGGRLVFQMQRSRSARLLSLDPLNLAIPALRWQRENVSKPAAWGTTGEGRTWLVLPEPSADAQAGATERLSLEGEWSALGRQLFDLVEFDLKFPPAAVTEMELFLPEGWTLDASAGQIEGPLAISPEGDSSRIPLNNAATLRLWKVHLGGETECELGVRSLQSGKPLNRLLLSESDTNYLVRERELQIESRFDLEVAFAPVSEVVFQVPTWIDVYGVTYGGDANIAWRVDKEETQKRIIIQLPDPLFGKSRPIRIQGLAQNQTGEAWQLPRITCPEAVLLRGDSHLTVEAPLELKSYDLAGFRQTAISVLADQRETFSFSQHAADQDSRLTVTIGTPAFTASAQTVGFLSTGTEEWLLRTEVAWAAHSGSQYVMTCDVLPGWEILDVRKPGESSLPVIADWQLDSTVNPPRLTIEFLEAITPMQSRKAQILARRLPLSGDQAMGMSCVKPLDVRSVEQFLAVDSDKGHILACDVSQGLQDATGEELPLFVQNASFYQTLASARSRRDLQLFHFKGEVQNNSLSLKRSEPPYDALAEVLLDFTDESIQETYIFSITPLDSTMDRLTILSPSLGEGWRWVLESEAAPAATLAPPTSATPESVLEERQSLQWDLKLPAPQSGPFRIRATRQLAASQLHQIRLPFLPVARDFQGTVELSSTANGPLDVKASLADEEPLAERPDPGRSEWLKRFRYVSPDASLTAAPLSSLQAATSPLGKLTLHSLINGHSQTSLHRAIYELDSDSRHLAFPFALPEGLRLIEVRLNGETVSTSETNEGRILYYLPAGQRNVIEICYEMIWHETGPVFPSSAPLPRTEVTVLDFTWQFALSPDLELADVPFGLTLSNPPPRPHWTLRFFGPLGQDTREAFFTPWKKDAWQSLWTSQPAEGTQPPAQNPAVFFPPNWAVFEAHGPGTPIEASLKIWNVNQVQGWAWIALLFSLTVGVALRIRQSALRGQLTWLWLVSNLLGATVLPWPWAFLCGGNIAGTLISLIVPRVFFSRRALKKISSHVGSTASYMPHPAVNAALLVALGLAVMGLFKPSHSMHPLYGQTSRPQIDATGKASTQIDEATIHHEFNVLIPVDNPQNIKRVASLVYVDRQFLKQLRAAQPKRQDDLDYLISAAAIVVNIQPQGAADVVADFEVVLLSPHKSVQIPFPVENAYLGGPGHCLVDGKPHSVFVKAGVPGFTLELSPDRSLPSAIAETPPGRRGKKPFVRHIRLTLHGTAALFPAGGRFHFSIPPVPASRFQANLSEVHASIKLRGASRPVLSATKAHSIDGTTGAVRKLDLIWSQQQSDPPSVTNRKSTVLASATIHPLWIEWQIRVKDQPSAGTTSALWNLPPNTVVKTVRSDRLDSFQVTGENEATRLLLKFQEPVAADSVIDIHCMTPRDQAQNVPVDRVQLPALSLFPPSAGIPELQESEYLLGISASPELAMGVIGTPAAGNEFSVVAPETFVSAYRLSASETLAIRPPQQAYRLPKPGELTLPVRLRLPAKRAWLNQEGQIGEREIRWTLTAEIETTGAKAFRHVFTVPEAFQIDAVSIQEDETERLVRWTKSGTRLELVLSDGTTGIQNVNISGFVPFSAETGESVPLPLVLVQNAEVVDSQLRVFQDRSLNRQLHVPGIEDLPPLDENGAFSGNSQWQLLAAVRLPVGSKPPAVLIGDPLLESRWDLVLVVEPENSLNVRITAILRLANPGQGQETLQLRLPPEMARDFRVESTSKRGVIVPYETLPNSDQSVDLLFASTSQESLRSLRIESLIELPADGRWALPNLEIIRGRLESRLLLASPDFEIVGVDQPVRPDHFPLDQLPNWFLKAQLLEGAWQDFQLYKEAESSWRIETAPANGKLMEHALVVDATLWLTDSRRISGTTRLRFPAQSLESLSWQWPNGTQLKGCLLDGKELFPAFDEDRQELRVLIPSRTGIAPASTSRSLEVHWSQEPKTLLSRFGQINVSLPKPKDLPAHDAHLAVIPAANVRLIPQSGIVASGSQSSEQIPQWAENAYQWDLSAESQEWVIALWTLDSRTESFLVMGLAVLVSAAVTNWALRRNLGDWFNVHPGIVCFLVGLLWWLAFAGSVFGFLMLASSPLLAWVFNRPTGQKAV